MSDDDLTKNALVEVLKEATRAIDRLAVATLSAAAFASTNSMTTTEMDHLIARVRRALRESDDGRA